MENDILKPYYETVFELIKDDPVLEKVFVVNRVSSTEIEYSGFNNGAIELAVNIQVPVNLFKELGSDSEIKQYEDCIRNAFYSAIKGDENISVDYVNIIPYARSTEQPPDMNSGSWQPGFFRMFISHKNENKTSASNLKIALVEYGISAFVAHEDIEPTKEWQDEIVLALRTMDALCAILTDHFKESDWCDQEVGFGLGRDVLCIPIRHGKNPYGILGMHQGIMASSDAHNMAASIFKILCKNDLTHEKYISTLSNLFLKSSSPEQANKWLNLIKKVPNLDKAEVNYIRRHLQDEPEPIIYDGIVDNVNSLFRDYGVDEYIIEHSPKLNETDNLPF